jgi:hypothetical protein
MLRSYQKLIDKSIGLDDRAVFGLCSQVTLEQKVEQGTPSPQLCAARKEAAMAVIPDDPETLRARLERMNQFASLARQAVTQARQAARSAAREAAAPYMMDHHRTCADE